MKSQHNYQTKLLGLLGVITKVIDTAFIKLDRIRRISYA